MATQLARVVTVLLLTGLALACDQSLRPLSPDDIDIYDAIIDDKLRVITVGKDCAQQEPVTIAIGLEEHDAPLLLLERLRRPCYQFIPASQYDPDNDVLIEVILLDWLSEDRAEATAVSVGQGGGITTEYSIRRAADQWALETVNTMYFSF